MAKNKYRREEGKLIIRIMRTDIPIPESTIRKQSMTHQKVMRKHPYKFAFLSSESVEEKSIDTKDKIAKYCWFKGGEGSYAVMGYSRGKTLTHKKLICLAKLDIKEVRGKVIYDFKHHKGRLKRYKFWKEKL